MHIKYKQNISIIAKAMKQKQNKTMSAQAFITKIICFWGQMAVHEGKIKKDRCKVLVGIETITSMYLTQIITVSKS